MKTKILALITLLILAPLSQADWIEQSNKNAMLVLEADGQFEPESASNLGLTAFDPNIMDVGSNVYERRKKSNTSLLQEMRKRL